MNRIKELKRISIEFRDLSSNLLNSGIDDVDVNLYRFKNYIDTESEISSIIKEKTKNEEIDFNKCFPINPSDWGEINIPVEESKHLKAIYDLIDYLVVNNISVKTVAFKYFCSDRRMIAIIQNYLDKTVKFLIDYIVKELSKEILIEEEERMPSINFTSGDNSTVSVAVNSNQNITSNITVNDENEIKKVIEDLKEELKKSDLSIEDKENIEDDLDVIKEQVENSVEKPTRLKKACSNLNNFLEGANGFIVKATTLGIGIQKLIELISSIINR